MLVIVAVVFFSLILSLSILREIPPIRAQMQRVPWLLNITPTWSFFAPIPGMHDYQLLFRAMSKHGQVTDWQEVQSLKDKRKAYTFLWNPEKKFLKSLMDLVQELLIFSRAANHESQIHLSIPYLHLLNYVSAMRFDTTAEKVQFMILSSSRMSDYRVVFVSGHHRIPEQP